MVVGDGGVMLRANLDHTCRMPDRNGNACLMLEGHAPPCMGSSRPVPMPLYDGYGEVLAAVELTLPKLYWRRLDPRARPPLRAYAGDAGWDLYALEAGRVPPYEFADVHTGVAVAIPDGYWARVTGRSSTVRNHNLLVVEAIIDQGWRGELFFGVRNLGARSVPIQAGDRLAQVILHERIDAEWSECEELPPGERGERGFGSSGR